MILFDSFKYLRWYKIKTVLFGDLVKAFSKILIFFSINFKTIN